MTQYSKLKEETRQWQDTANLKEETLDHTLWWTHFGRAIGPGIRYTTEGMNEIQNHKSLHTALYTLNTLNITVVSYSLRTWHQTSDSAAGQWLICKQNFKARHLTGLLVWSFSWGTMRMSTLHSLSTNFDPKSVFSVTYFYATEWYTDLFNSHIHVKKIILCQLLKSDYPCKTLGFHRSVVEDFVLWNVAQCWLVVS